MTANRDELIELGVQALKDARPGMGYGNGDVSVLVDAGWRPPPTGDVIEAATSVLVEHPSVPNYAAQVAGDVFAMRCPACGADDIAGPNSPNHARHQAQALADAGYLASPEPPVYLALDLWMALGCDSGAFDAYYARNGWAETWAALLAAVREALGETPCGVMTDGEPCVLLPHSDMSAHHGASDVGRGEPVPWVATPVQQDTALIRALNYFRWCLDCGKPDYYCSLLSEGKKCCPDCRHRAAPELAAALRALSGEVETDG